MGPPDNTKVAFGIAAAAAVVVVSYFLVKKLGIAGGDNRRSAPKKDETYASVVKEVKEKHARASPTKSSKRDAEHPSTAPTSQQQPELSLESKYVVNEEGYLQDSNTSEDTRRGRPADDGQNQSSFIVIDNGEGTAPPDNGQQGKKSDRSSDESSYDVIDDDRLAEAVDEGEGDEAEGKNDGEKEEGEGKEVDTVAEMRTEAESFLEVNETSMVVIEDSERSAFSKSGSSFYVSADENVGAEGTSGETEGDEVGKKKTGEGDASLSEDDQTVMFTGENKSFQSADTSSQAQVGDVSTNAASEESTQEIPLEMNQEEMTQVLTTCQNSPVNVSREEISKLMILLKKNSPELHSMVLNCLVRLTAFTQNITPLREDGCAAVIATQVQENCEALTKGQPRAEGMLNSLCQVLTNLSMDPKTQEELEDTIPVLIDVLLLESASDSIKLSILRPLVNLSSPTTFHSHFTRAIQKFFSLLDTGSQITKVQSLKVLVNLSLNADMVPHMLAAKAPACLLDLLDHPTSTDLILRAVTMLANVHKAVHEGSVSPDSLPVEEKAASPETLYMAVTGVDQLPNLRNKIFRLTRHEDEDVCQQASRLYQYITEPSE